MNTGTGHVNISDQIENEDKNIFFQKLISKFFALWPWLIVSVGVCVALGLVYLSFTSPEYRVTASILVQDDKKGTDLGEAEVLQGFGLLSGKSNVDNEVEIFKSRTLMQQVVQDLQLNIRYYISGKFRKSEIFNRPASLRFIRWNNPDGATAQYNITINRNTRTFNLQDGTKNFAATLGDTLQLKAGDAIVEAGDYLSGWPEKELMLVTISPFEGVVRQYMGSLNIAIPNKQVSVIDLSLTENLPGRGELILNDLVNAYMEANVNDKNRMADGTVKFIDERLALVFKELSGIEKDIEGFKTENKLTDLSAQSRLLLENTSEYMKEQTTQEVQLSVINSLENFLKDNANSARVVPSSLVMQDPNFIALVQRYNEIELTRDKLLMSQTVDHPSVITIDGQLRNLRQDLLSSIASVKRGVQVSINELKNRTNGFESQISKVPAKERLFLDFSRQQEIKQELYVFLLKKREETAISKSSNVANARIIDKAKADMFPLKPKKKAVIIQCFLLAILLPFGISFLFDFLNTKVNSLDDVTSTTRVPVLAEIGHNEQKDALAITPKAKTIISEQLRALRTNLEYVLADRPDKIILTTSSMSGEGKSFLSINLSAALTLADKKVILLELDLRKPKITENLNLVKKGFTNYVVSKEENLEQWIQPSGVMENFDVLASGPIPPNPSELLMMLPRMNYLFDQLKQKYDYIVIDTSPVGLVTDAQILAKHASATLYIVRHGFTHKQQLRILEKLYKKNVMPKMNIVINDIHFTKSGGGSYYGYAYDYYGYGYDTDEKTSKRKKLKFKI